MKERVKPKGLSPASQRCFFCCSDRNGNGIADASHSKLRVKRSYCILEPLQLGAKRTGANAAWS